MTRKGKIALYCGLVLIVIGYAVGALFAHRSSKAVYWVNQGQVFGTYYNIRYQADSNQEDLIKQQLQAVDMSLSMFNPQSVLARINRNEEVETDSLFEVVYHEAIAVSRLSDGAFDWTVAPIVNAWGFGFKNKETVTADTIDSLMQLVGYEKISLQQHRIIKSDHRVMIDANAIAKGFACDVVANALENAGCSNYLVDIGGEVVLKGVKKQGEPWSVGITKPIDDSTGTIQELQEVIQSSELKMATSGNYRNFYYEGDTKRSHTIDPRTGYPIQHRLLSATVIASSCMRADALATACMVLGEAQGLELIERTDDAACYFILDGENGLEIQTSSKWQSYIDRK